MKQAKNMKNEFIIQKPGGVVLKAIQELSGDEKGWVSLKTIYKFIDTFFEGGVDADEPAYDLARFEDVGWLKPINYIPSLEKFVYLTERGRKVTEKSVMPPYAKNDFFDSVNKARNAAT